MKRRPTPTATASPMPRSHFTADAKPAGGLAGAGRGGSSGPVGRVSSRATAAGDGRKAGSVSDGGPTAPRPENVGRSGSGGRSGPAAAAAPDEAAAEEGRSAPPGAAAAGSSKAAAAASSGAWP